MKKVLLIVNEFIELKNADSKAFISVFNILEKKTNIFVLSNDDKKLINVKLITEDHSIFSINNRGSFLAWRESNLKISKILRNLLKLFFWPDPSLSLTKPFTSAALELIIKYNIENIITLSGSFATQIVGSKIKERIPQINWISIMYDPLPKDNFVYRNRGILLNKRKMSKILNKADYIYALEPLYFRYNKLYPNIRICGLPLLTKMAVISDVKISNDIQFYYIGSINTKVRNPKIMIETLNRSVNAHRFKVNFVGTLDNKSRRLISKKASFDYKLIDYLEPDQLLEIYRKDSFLLNLGNKNEFQIPSKIIEYMSSGLPIISFEPLKSSSKYSPLKYYNNSFIVYEEDASVKFQDKFDEFTSKKIKRCQYDHIDQSLIIYTPDHNFKLIESILI